MKIRNVFFLFLCVVAFATCIRPPDYPIEPQITFSSMTKNVMRQGYGTEDSVYINLTFTDGDGDLGGVGSVNGSKDSLNVFITDKRNNKPVEQTYRIPFVPEAGAKNGISGELKFLMFTTCCLSLEPCRPPAPRAADTLVYEIYIKDRAGHKSNAVQTKPILLQCK
jgi:hypothetical protein